MLRCFARGAARLALFILPLLLEPALASGQPPCETAAEIVSAEGDVAVVMADNRVMPVSSAPEVFLCPGATIRTGPRSRAAIRLVKSGQIIRIDQSTELRIFPRGEQDRPLLNLGHGLLQLFSPGAAPLDVMTPFVTAGVEGTEFFVLSTGSLVEVGVGEGEVRVRHRRGELLLMSGEATWATRDQPPTQKIPINPKDQVRWAIHYPPVMWDEPPPGRLDYRVDTAWRAWRSGNLAAAIAAIRNVDPAGVDPMSRDYLGAILVSVGRTDEAGTFLGCPDSPGTSRRNGSAERARITPTATPRAHALCAIVAVARNEPTRGLEEAQQAVALDPSDVGAQVALSYALQAALRLEEAESLLINFNRFDNALIEARLAEVEFYLGRIEAAREAADHAVRLTPSLSRPYSILGFAALANNNLAAAAHSFRLAAARDRADPLPRIGLGLTAIRGGALATGRAEMETAVALDPVSSVFRSYLGKAYASEQNYDAARREWMLAQELDPRDPTAFLYRAFAERALNRPAEALADVNRSIERNDYRAVYRSRLLLDQDLATRTADLASIYRDLGFEQAALVEGYKSVNADPANPAAHRFLSETFLALPRHESASDSELLQSLLLQPLDVNPPRPRLSREGLGIIELLGPSRVGYNEFSPLFAANGIGLLADGFAGDRNTAGGTLLLNGLYQDFSGSIGQFYSRSTGIHANGDLRRRVTDVIFQPALSEKASILAEARYSDFEAGDPQNRFDLANFNPVERQTDRVRQYRLGGHLDAAPGVTLAGVWTRGSASGLTAPGIVSLGEHESADTGEAVVYLTGRGFNGVLGGSAFQGRDQLRPVVFGRSLPITNSQTTEHGVWAYGNVFLQPNLRITVGGHFEELQTFIRRTQFDPKVGLSWDVQPDTTVRAAWFKRLSQRRLLALTSCSTT
jgi:tetratricopeptide (TPR) repeat protein